jgi:DNA-binding transcriptional MerR regulator
MKPLPIGALSRETGVKVPTIRFYEQIGLLPAPERAENNRRSYGPEAVRRLRFIRHARELGFEVEAIRQLLDMARDPERSCGEVHEITRAHLDEVNGKIARLVALRDELQAMVACDNRKISECRIIEVLADHGQCSHHRHPSAERGLAFRPD